MADKGYLGIDCGSASVKFALIDEEGNVQKTSYRRNRGLIETVKDSLRDFSDLETEVQGVGVTGSGRKFVGQLVGADVVKTEVLAHTYGALNFYPDMRTLVDIGGEDSKLMIVQDGVLHDFVLNNTCSAGTGSCLESIANRIGVDIKDVGDLATQSENPIEVSTKCGVFIQSAVVTHLNSGASKEDILKGVVNGMVENYLTMAQGRKLEEPIIYQGATARNKAIVRSLEEQTGKNVIVPEYCEVMGAIGMALLTQREGVEQTKFRGYEIGNRDFKTRSYQAQGCGNKCGITLIYEDEKYVGALGNKCEQCVPKKG